MRKLLLAGLWPLPPLGLRLWLTLAGLAVGVLNLVFLAEIWPHTPAAATTLLVLLWLLVLALLPQATAWAWRWLRAYAGPGWVRVLATAAFLGGAGVVLVGGPLFFLHRSGWLGSSF